MAAPAVTGRPLARRIVAAALMMAASLLATPQLALACPYCARPLSPGTFALLGAMILSPFAVVAIVVRIIRRVDSGRDA
ncbi:MAG: hypothetical protein HY292_22650 [Planctomycetes bacterium]|nr:hypothetical protein [Planctomycetota bacterium]